VAHAIGDRMVGAGGVAAHTQSPKDLSLAIVQSNAAAEGNDAAGVADRRA
jgi:hypothetical protein